MSTAAPDIKPTAEEEREAVILQGQVSCDAEDETFVKAWLLKAAERADPGNMLIDRFYVADPLAEKDHRARPLFKRMTLRPAAKARETRTVPIISTVPLLLVRLSAWAAIVGLILRLGSAQGDLRLSTRGTFSVIGALMYMLSTVVLFPGFQPAVFTQHVLKTFAFWYLGLHIAAACFFEAEGLIEIHGSTESNVVTHVIVAVSLIVGFLGAEAFSMSPGARASRYALLCGICIAEIFVWALGHDHRDDILDLLLFKSTIGAMAQTLYLGLAAFMVRAITSTLDGGSPPYLPLPVGSVEQSVDDDA